jgi:ribosomal protein L7Ae-like RNA K-turn-binding protein
LRHEPVTLLLVAEDTAPERLREYQQRCTSRQIPHRPFLTKARLGELVGRDESSAIGIQDARLSERLISYLEGMGRLMER